MPNQHYRMWTLEEDCWLTALHGLRLTQLEACACMDRSKSTVEKHAKRLGLVFKRAKGEFSEEELIRFQELWDAKVPRGGICRQMGWRIARYDSVMRKLGLPRRPSRIKREVINEVLRRLQHGSYTEVARELEMTAGQVAGIDHRYGGP